MLNYIISRVRQADQALRHDALTDSFYYLSARAGVIETAVLLIDNIKLTVSDNSALREHAVAGMAGYFGQLAQLSAQSREQTAPYVAGEYMLEQLGDCLTRSQHRAAFAQAFLVGVRAAPAPGLHSSLVTAARSAYGFKYAECEYDEARQRYIINGKARTLPAIMQP